MVDLTDFMAGRSEGAEVQAHSPTAESPLTEVRPSVVAWIPPQA